MKNLLLFILTLLIILNGCKSKTDSSSQPKEDSNLKETFSVDFNEPFYSQYGKGKLVINFKETLYQNKPYFLNFYNSDKSDTISETVKLNWEKGSNRYVENYDYVKIYNAEFINVEDFYIEEPDFILMFNCLNTSNGFYEVLVNVETHETKWIKNEATVEYKLWERFLIESICVSALNPETNPVRFQPNEEAEIPFNDIVDECWEVIDLKGDWIQVKCSQLDFDLSVEKYRDFVGWLKWKNDKELLIEYYLSI